MYLINLPEELVEIIISYTYGKCDQCKQLIHFDNLTYNCRIFEYKNVFQDEFWNPDDENMRKFNLICKPCIHDYGNKIIINLHNNTYCWIQDYML